MGVRHTPVALQKLSPSRNLHLDNETLPIVEQACARMMQELRAAWMPKLFEILTEKSKERFSFRKQAVAEKKGLDAAWEEATIAMKELQGILREDGKGPFVLGTQGQSFYLSLPPSCGSKLNMRFLPSVLCRFLPGSQSAFLQYRRRGYF